MSAPDNPTLRAKGIYRVWSGLPRSVRRPISTVFDHLNLRSRLLGYMGLGRRDGFITMTPETPPAIYECLKRTAEAGPAGDYYEFGMFRGYSFWYAQASARRLRLDRMRFFGFDSFQGLPEPEGDESVEFARGDYACGRAEVEGYLNKYGVDWSRTTLVEGFYNESLKPELKAERGMRPAAVVLIDCDLYTSTRDVLAFIDDLLQDGTVLMFDDWNCFSGSDEAGERKAFREYLASRPQWRAEEYISFGWHGQAFVLRAAQDGAGAQSS
ncbi:MAG TPA: TylF/MycF/NovP-related O-methyltransferase [Pyrinomonadaceae bacterium]|jgi:hypothetical protein